MKNKSLIIIICITAFLLVFSIIPKTPFYNINWALFSTIIIGILMAAFFMKFENKKVSSKEITLLATVSTIGAVSRVPFAALMSIQPTTFMVMITGYVFGPHMGFMCGAVSALVSNFFLGQGPWTPWQMFCWGMCGAAAVILSGKEKKFNLIAFTVLGGICGFVFGWVMNIWHWISFVYPLNLKTFIATYAASLPFDSMHALGNILFSLIFGRSFYHVLLRFKKKIIPYTQIKEDI